ncbi:histidinol dehydrogenase [Halalkalicoccus jeotgali]|uniref:Histidinol dehydrogenase n=1 Tax=Halalkalicoccus jeotgali (strain DSM 18796 / CECT 7217 / JCM 14584 / KCTC 4019 / B3) TaxID=795797 RepID=D8JAT1_HALJB|nr:histidinol dehydrogenase [Halalkalicoccus jeotgali]ADJ14803.1 histidinol dehydrogenase [Halalkalicoccus jeotgali B3]ELY39385.1 bifunctional histidinal dehydrogenase/ histidinol dehydrogenase [Halalkalicoccus jeotgali B3]
MNVQSIADLGPERRRALFERDAGIEAIRGDVGEIVERVREEGDVAVREFCREFDAVDVGNLDITDAAERAFEAVDADTRAAIETAAENVWEFHERQLPEDWREEFAEGRELGRRFRPLDRVGVYVPGGAAAYPSSALMGVIPATVAGVETICVATPPAEEINPVTLAAIHAAGADEVYSVGGAQAIGALAYGTESVTRVQKVVGPGNRWVTAAKAEVRGDCEIDFLAGPSEVLVIADETAEPAFVASDLLAQAEHDENASVVAVTTDRAVAEAIAREVDERAADRDRRETIEAALEQDASGVFAARSMSEAIAFAEAYAAEHLSIQADGDEAVLDRIDSAGSVFLGPYTPVAAGDYASGTNHVLPTNGLAKVTGGLSIEQFLRASTVQRLSPGGLDSLSDTIDTLARAEGLEAHAESVAVRSRERAEREGEGGEERDPLGE